MCLNQRRDCRCGRHGAFFIFRGNLLPPEILVELYCPECRHRANWDDATMLVSPPKMKLALPPHY